MSLADRPFLGDPEELRRALAIQRAVRDCPHRSASSCAGRARCALGKGKAGRVERGDCEACVAESLEDDRSIEDLMSPAGDSFGLPQSPVLFDADDRPVPLAGTREGRAVALFCGGPSLAATDLRPFFEPWVDRAAVNNAGALVRPHWWFAVDHPNRFHQDIWLDPTVRKFSPRDHRQCAVRARVDGAFAPLGRVASACPSVAFYRRHRSFDHVEWLSEETLSWGCDRDRACSLGERGASSVMFVALKILLVLGYRAIVLVGCDWMMDPAGAQYGFAQAKDRTACDSNNRAYAVNGKRLAALRAPIESIGARVVNATPGSHLRAFDHVPPAEALALVEAANRREPDLSHWYDS